MKPINWIFIALFIIDFGLFIASYFIKKELLTKITSIVLLPLLTLNPMLFLFRFTPDSYHCIQYSIFAILFFWIFQVLMIFNKNKFTFIAAKIFYLLGILTWICYYRTTFYVYIPPFWLTVLLIIIFAGIIVVSLLLATVKETKFSFRKNIGSIFTIGAIEFLIYCSLTALIHSHKPHNIVLFVGMILLLFTVTFYLVDAVQKKAKFPKEIRQTAILLSQFAICLSNLMIFID